MTNRESITYRTLLEIVEKVLTRYEVAKRPAASSPSIFESAPPEQDSRDKKSTN